MGSALLEHSEKLCLAATLDEPQAAQSRDDYHDVGQLCCELRMATDSTQRDRLRRNLITRCLPLADHIACRFGGRGESAEDLTQVARLGMIKAVDRYDPARGAFLSYAVPTIMGEVRRHFRDQAWVLHVPRKIKDTHRRVRAAIDPLAQRLGRAPTAGELATELGIDRDEVVRVADATYAYRPASLDATAPGGRQTEMPATRHGAEDPRYERVEDALMIAEVLRALSERERLILRMRFCENLPQSQIGQRLGVSQVQVSRLLTTILERLRERLLPQ